MAQLNRQLSQHRDRYGTKIVYSTGRSLTSYRQLCTEKPLLPPDAVVTGVGTAIYFDPDAAPEAAWANFLNTDWERDQVVAIAAAFESLVPQPDAEQGPFKVSYFLPEAVASEVLPTLHDQLQAAGLQVNVIYSGGKDLDILPRRANKGLAMDFLRDQWAFEPDVTVACGDSGNDRALFDNRDERGIIVGNAMRELLEWHHTNPVPHRYLARAHCAGGILEGLAYFNFL